MHALVLAVMLLTPARTWFPPNGPVTINVSAKEDSKLVMTDFSGVNIEPSGSAAVTGDKAVDIKAMFPKIAAGGTFVLYEVPKDKSTSQFVGTPLVIEVVTDQLLPPDANIDVIRVRPLEYAVIHTASGNMTAMFYYDVARKTVDSFLQLASEGFYDKLSFHRILPGFVLQGGDPRGDGTGGPGYQVPAEFNDRPHDEGVLSMARSSDPNSAGSQFFICLDYKQTQHLDHQYTAFGKLSDGLAVAHEIEKTPLADAQAGKPVNPPVIDQIEVKPVVPGENPYAALLRLDAAAAQPAAK
jgi:peptidyl-prolyl cis-trans isomerase B (cyclophilin B)